MMGVSLKNSYDVAVVGSGPAGSMSAFSLAREGVRVVVIEKASLPRHKTCGGGVIHKAIQLLPVDVTEVIERECYSAELTLGANHLHFTTKREKPIISVTMREKFDFLLISAAEDAGADIRSKCKVLDVITQGDKVELVTSEGSLFARFVVAADGAMSIMARKAGWRETRTLTPALVFEVFVSDGVLERFDHAARFDFGLFPFGYAWIIPKKDHLSMGVLSKRLGPMKLREMWERYLQLIGLDKIVSMKGHGAFIPMSPRKDGFVKGRVILTGDAAGLAEPVTGEGITFALLSGQIAAKALLDGAFEEAKVRRFYESELSKRILRELRFGRVLAKLFYEHPGVINSLFGLYGQKFTGALTGVVMGEKTYRKLLSNLFNCLELIRIWYRRHNKGHARVG